MRNNTIIKKGESNMIIFNSIYNTFIEHINELDCLMNDYNNKKSILDVSDIKTQCMNKIKEIVNYIEQSFYLYPVEMTDNTDIILKKLRNVADHYNRLIYDETLFTVD